mgnify:CR=1 FL=1
MNRFGQRMKALRKEIGVSQSFVADHIGVSTQSVSNWECDNTMPDISQIVPLAALLSVSTDYLLGVGTNERADKEELENKVKEIWATYSVNTTANNADLLVYELYKNYLNKYPLDYVVKVKCAFAIQDYLHVVRVRKKFDIPEERFDELWLECDRMLRSVCDNCTHPEIQIDAKNSLIDLLLLKEMFEEAGTVAMKLPDLCGIRDRALCKIAQTKGDTVTACEKAESACKYLMFDYVTALFYRAKTLSENSEVKREKVLQAWDDMIEASSDLVRLYADPSDLVVNGFDKNPYCYLITSYTSKCNFFICQGNITEALSCAENAMNTAIKMYTWARTNCFDSLVKSDILFFVQHTPNWCHKWAESEQSKELTQNSTFAKNAEKIRHLSV